MLDFQSKSSLSFLLFSIVVEFPGTLVILPDTKKRTQGDLIFVCQIRS